VVERFAGLNIGQRMAVEFVGQELVGGVGFNQQPLRGDMPKGFALTHLARVRKVARQREISAQLRQRGDQFPGAAVRMQQKPAAGARFGAQDFEQPAPGLETMDAQRQVAFRRQPQLPDKHRFLPLEIRIGNPAIQPRLPQGGGDGFEMPQERRLPIGGAFLHIPGMATEGRDDLRAFAGQGQHLRPVTLTRTVDHHPGDARAPQGRPNRRAVRRQPVVLQMIMRVAKPVVHGVSPAAGGCRPGFAAVARLSRRWRFPC